MDGEKKNGAKLEKTDDGKTEKMGEGNQTDEIGTRRDNVDERQQIRE